MLLLVAMVEQAKRQKYRVHKNDNLVAYSHQLVEVVLSLVRHTIKQVIDGLDKEPACDDEEAHG